MDISGTVRGAIGGYSATPKPVEAGGAKFVPSSVSVPVKTPEPVQVNQSAVAEVTPEVIDKQRADAVAQAATVVRDYFAVSDTRFTIFKNGSGEFITKFTSLRDGSITYFPEPELFKLYGKISGGSSSLFKTNA
jgi:hypothetical protein